MKRARGRAMEENKDSTLMVTGGHLSQAAGHLKKSTSTGLDLWSLADFAQCDKEDLDRLAAIMMEWDTEMVVPQPWMTNLMAMIPKKKGHRCIATMASGFRMYTSLRVVPQGGRGKAHRAGDPCQQRLPNACHPMRLGELL